MLKITVFVALIVTVYSAPQYQQEQQQQFRSPETGKLLRVVGNEGTQTNPTVSKIFYYVPANVDVSQERAAKNQKISTLPTDPNFLENTMKIIEDKEKADLEVKGKLVNNEQVGVYYIYHPNGVLQKVEYLTKNDDDMTVSTRVRYKVVEPIKGPIYTYDPQTLLYRQI